MLQSKLITKLDPDTAIDSKQVLVLNESFVTSSFESEIQTTTHMEGGSDSVLDIAIDEAPCYPDNVIKLEQTYLSDENEFETNENDIKIEVLDDTDETEQLKEVQPVPLKNFNERKFLKAISMRDRNKDGTVKVKAIERLGLDSWTAIPYRCYICHEQWVDRFEWQQHMKIAHTGHPMRNFCNICNVKHYASRSHLRKHIISVHRPYFKFW